jgi:hypothetical protein
MHLEFTSGLHGIEIEPHQKLGESDPGSWQVLYSDHKPSSKCAGPFCEAGNCHISTKRSELLGCFQIGLRENSLDLQPQLHDGSGDRHNAQFCIQ